MLSFFVRSEAEEQKQRNALADARERYANADPSKKMVYRDEFLAALKAFSDYVRQ
jgi:hypothetical protein